MNNENNTTTIINKTERPNSMNFRVGGAGTPEFKIYFEDERDLEKQLAELAGSDLIRSHIDGLKQRFVGDKQ